MDDLERRIAAQLMAADPDDQPAPWLGPRILAQVRRRRRWRAYVSAAAVASAVVAIAASTVVLLAEPAPRPAAPVLPQPGPITSQPPRAADLDELIDPDTVVRVPSQLTDRSRFEVMAVDAAGTLVGARRSTSAGQPEDVWFAGPTHRAPVRLQDTPPDPYLWIMAVDGDAYVWPDRESLKCAERAGPGRARVLDSGWGGRTEFYAGGGAIVWTTTDWRLKVADGCHGPVRSLPARGVLEAFAYPHAFLRDQDGLRQVDVRNGLAQPVPGGPPQSTSSNVPVTMLAANASLLAWAEVARAGQDRERGGSVTTLDRLTGARRLSTLDLQTARDPMYSASLTAGNRLLAFSTRHQDVDLAYSVVIDPQTGRTAAVPGRVWASGDWLAWRDGDDYKIAIVR